MKKICSSFLAIISFIILSGGMTIGFAVENAVPTAPLDPANQGQLGQTQPVNQMVTVNQANIGSNPSNTSTEDPQTLMDEREKAYEAAINNPTSENLANNLIAAIALGCGGYNQSFYDTLAQVLSGSAETADNTSTILAKTQSKVGSKGVDTVISKISNLQKLSGVDTYISQRVQEGGSIAGVTGHDLADLGQQVHNRVTTLTNQATSIINSYGNNYAGLASFLQQKNTDANSVINVLFVLSKTDSAELTSVLENITDVNWLKSYSRSFAKGSSVLTAINKRISELTK